MKVQRGILFSVALAALIFGITDSGGSANRSQSVGYWLWAGITPDLAPTNAELYVLQGHFETDSVSSTFERQGLYPHPIKCSKLFLVYRLEGGFPAADSLLAILQQHVRRWERHPVKVDGIQLDFDSPTSRLDAYATYLAQVRKMLPARYQLSITGLGDWAISGSTDAIRDISKSVDDIVFQLYQGRSPLPDIDNYLTRLKSYPLAFRVGLLNGHETPKLLTPLNNNYHFKGTLYFIQRGR